MGGLLYKEFVSVSGKKYTVILICIIIVFGVLRAMFPGDEMIDFFRAVNENGEEVNILDTFYLMFVLLMMVSFLGLINIWVAKITGNDEKYKIKNYLYAMPLEKNTYIASKYVFLGIAAYVMMTVLIICSIICGAFYGNGSEAMQNVNALILPAISLSLFSATIELPMFILLKKQRAMYIKEAISMLLAFAAVGFLLFGDLQWFSEKFNLVVLFAWMDAHAFEVSLVQVVSPVITLLLYYASYRLTCYFVGRGMVCDE